MIPVIPWLDQGIQKGYAGFIVLDSRESGNDILRDNVMTKQKQLIWVYPPNNWVSNFNKTFVYGWCNPKTKLFISVVGADPRVCPKIKEGKHMGLPVQPIQIFPNGNFAQTIKLPEKKNIVQLIQVLGKKKTVISRTVVIKHVRADQRVCPKIASGKHIGLSVQKKDIVIVIDPGHGGKEHGTHSPKGIPEKVFNLQIAKMLYKKLRRGMPWHARENIYLTRSKDKFISLKDRVNFAKKKKCNIFISIHHNALPDNEDPLKHRGVGIYYTHDSVKPFAKKLLESISKEVRAYCNTPLRKYGIFKRDFAVTRPDSYRGVLIECGFLIHPEESEYVIRKNVQEKFINGITRSITNLF